MGYCFVQVKVKKKGHGNDLEGRQSKVKESLVRII